MGNLNGQEFCLLAGVRIILENVLLMFRYYISTDLLHCIKIFCIHTYYVHMTRTSVVGIYHYDSCRCTNVHFLNLFRYIYHLGDRIVCSWLLTIRLTLLKAGFRALLPTSSGRVFRHLPKLSLVFVISVVLSSHEKFGSLSQTLIL
jgi:hypothetical protein